jgi:hypothetical protein
LDRWAEPLRSDAGTHDTNIHLGQHRLAAGHSIKFSSISTLDKATGYSDCLLKEAIKIRLQPGNFNRYRDSNLSQSWYPVTYTIKQYRQTQSRERAKPSELMTIPTGPPWASA